ncbi:SH3-domain-containing protein, partial [Macrolepiota fuliginosa MF-IS2]
MTHSDSQSATLLTHIVSQVENNVEFLVSQGYITRADASQFLAKLPSSDAQSKATVPSFPTPPRSIAPPSLPAPTPAAAAPVVPKARAIWAWTGQDAGDLSIQQGDVIEILEETNGDWWTGRLNGRQGLFPAAYVERVQVPVATATTKDKPVYKPFRAAHHGTDKPPAAGGPTNSIGLQEAPGQEEKKSKYGALGNTMAHSAAGGVGFGAG